MAWLALLLVAAASAASLPYTGVNLAGADFGEGNLPGTYGKDYIYPTSAEVDYFKTKKMNIIRLPFRWERLQQKTGANFDSAEWSRLDGFVSYATSKGFTVLLDPHNYARYYGNIIGNSSVTAADFANFWSLLAAKYASNTKVWFGLCNEPNTMSTETWFADAQAAINAIRRAGSNNTIALPGNAWTGAASWTQNWYGTSNSIVSLTVSDPSNNMIIDVHQYLDSDSSGTHKECVSATIGVERLTDFVAWCKTNNKRAILSEMAGSTDSSCVTALNNMFSYMEQHSDVFVGWTWWAAGPWWGDYMYSIEPNSDGSDKGQWSVLKNHVQA